MSDENVNVSTEYSNERTAAFPGELSVAEMKSMLGDAAKLLWQVCNLTSGVIQTMPVEDVREMCVQQTPTERTETQARTTRKPLTVLIRMGLQAASLMRQIFIITHWKDLNQLPVAVMMRLQAERFRLLQKKVANSGARSG